MTTIVYDQAKGLVCSDSRWSVPREFWVLYVDEAPFYKIAVTEDEVWLFAGAAPQIDRFKKYLAQYSNKGSRPSISLDWLDAISVLVADPITGCLVGSHQADIIWPTLENPSLAAAGTGSSHAVLCWMANKCPKHAVETAKQRDIYSGGQVNYFGLSSRETNLGVCQGMGCLNDAFLEGGKVMFTNEARVYTFSEAAKINAEVAELLDSAASGALAAHVQAPCDAMFNASSESEKRSFLATVGIPVQE